MAPCNDVQNTERTLQETNGQSARLFFKHQDKFDVSTVNGKSDFMKSLQLLSLNNTKSRIDRPLSMSPTNLQFSTQFCNDSGEKSSTFEENLTRIKNIQCCSRNNNSLSSRLKKDVFLDNCNDFKENCAECNNFHDANELPSEISESTENNLQNKKKKTLTKLTLKIGKEVISKVYCKRKYLNKTAKKAQPSNLADRNLDRIRKMASALVELEVRRKSQSSSHRNFFEGNNICDSAEDIEEIEEHENNNSTSNYEIITIDDETDDLNDEDDCVIVEEKFSLRNCTSYKGSSYELNLVTTSDRRQSC